MFVYIIIFLITIFLSIFETNISYVTIGGRKVATSKISFVIVLFYYWEYAERVFRSRYIKL